MYQANFVAVSGGIVTLSAVRDNNSQPLGQTLNYLSSISLLFPHFSGLKTNFIIINKININDRFLSFTHFFSFRDKTRRLSVALIK